MFSKQSFITKQQIEMTNNIISIFSTSALLVLFCFLGYPTPLFSQDKASEIDAIIQAYADDGQFNGTALVAENGKVIFKKGYGYANMDWQIPNKPDTKFRIGSITKQFVAMQIMQLVEDGKINLEGKLTDYLPEYREDTGDKITIHHLLTHTSGIPSYTGLPGFWSDSTRNPYPKDYMIRHFHSGNLEFNPGLKFNYNNSGYYLLAGIIERITGKSFEENLHETIITPLEMKNSGVDRNERLLENRAAGYMRNISGFRNDPYFYMTNALGAGDMYSTVEDLFLWGSGFTFG